MKRATANTAPLLPTVVNFNPRPREEGDDVYDEPVLDVKDFNPRPREEGDNHFLGEFVFRKISIHALVKRATVSLSLLYYAFVFQSTPS